MLNRDLLIIGAGIYGAVAAEIATDMDCFDNIDFIDDTRDVATNGKKVVGTTGMLRELGDQYGNIVVAIGDPAKRMSILRMIESDFSFRIVSLISPKAYISKSAEIGIGCVIEPMAVVHTNCLISAGCIISAGAVVNHFGICREGVHVDCNATVEGCCVVPRGTKVCSGDVYKRNAATEIVSIF